MRNREGSAVISVLLVMLAGGLLLTISLYITNLEVKISQGYSKNADLLYASKAGAAKAVSAINEIIMKNNNQILEDTLSTLAATYKNNNFYGADAFNTAFRRKLFTVLRNDLSKDSYFTKFGNTYSFQFDIKSGETEETFTQLRTKVEFLLTGTASAPVYKITSTTTNAAVQGKEITVAEIEFPSVGEEDIVIYENYKWKQVPEYMKRSLFVFDELITKDSAVFLWDEGDANYVALDDNLNYNDIDEVFENCFHTDSLTETIQFVKHNPVLVLNEDSMVDIADFHDEDGKAVPSVVINRNPASDTRIYTTGANEFFGIIVSNGTVIFENTQMHINGMVIANNIIFENSTVYINYQNSILDIHFENSPLRRNLLDFFKLTSYGELSHNTTYTTEQLNARFTYIQIQSFLWDITFRKEILFHIASLKEDVL